MRSHRTPVERILYSNAFRCGHCGRRSRWVYPAIRSRVGFLFSRYTRCIRCGSTRIERLTRRDRIDPVVRSLPNQLVRLTGAPIKKCPTCRLQYYDWRPIAPVNRRAPP